MLTHKPTCLALLALAACSSSAPVERYGFIARLGSDTVSLESVTRRGNTLDSEEVDRFPAYEFGTRVSHSPRMAAFATSKCVSRRPVNPVISASGLSQPTFPAEKFTWSNGMQPAK